MLIDAEHQVKAGLPYRWVHRRRGAGTATATVPAPTQCYVQQHFSRAPFIFQINNPTIPPLETATL